MRVPGPKSHQLDVINIQSETAAYGMSPWVHFLPDVLRPIPVVTTFHDLLVPYLFPKAGILRSWIVMRLARASAGVVATNQEDYSRLQTLTNSELIPIGSNITPSLPEDFDRDKYRAMADANEQDTLLAHFGFVNHSKGLETLLRATSLLRAERFPAKIVMIGGRTGSSDPSNAAYTEELERLIDKLDLINHIHWTGFIDDDQISAYFAAADMVVLPFRDGASYRRGSLMAAIQHGCKIITTQPAVRVDTFSHGENMLLFLSGDIELLMTLIRQVANGEHPDLGEGALELAKRFDWNLITDQYVSLFEQVLEPAR
jgi:glycosyltransferase involved in cell wall biosynthesis